MALLMASVPSGRMRVKKKVSALLVRIRTLATPRVLVVTTPALMRRAAAVLLAYGVISVLLTAGKPWLERIPYYFFDLIFIGAVWFCGTQYTDAVKQKNDYGNRKTIAQSFHNIMNNLPEDQEIKNKFIEKATDVLCAPSVVGGSEPILSKKVLKDVAELVATVAKK